MVKKPRQRQSTLPKPNPKPKSILDRPYARALLYSASICLTIIIGIVAGRWYRTLSPPDIASLYESPLFTVVDLPGRGKGVIAIRNITQGTMVLKEKSLFFVPPSIKESPNDLIISLVSRLTPEEQAQFNALSHHAGADSKEIPLSKFETNAISAGYRLGIFPRTARLNHGCSSAFNVVYSWREDEKVLVTYAFKPIKEGEELLTAYVDTKKPRHERQDYLQRAYHFECQCAVCSLPTEASRLSDKRLAKMTQLKTELSSWEQKRIGGQEATAIVNEIWRIGDDEGYWSERGSLAWDAMYIAAAHWDEEATRDWAMLAQLWFSIELGADSNQALDASRIIRKPQSHPQWGSRYQMKVNGPIAPLY